jgi:hypothetical protein
MRKLAATMLAGIVALVLLAPTPSFAWHGGRRVVHHHHGGYNGAAIAAGVLGGIATGIFLDRVLFPPVVVEAAPPPAPRDPYDAGYSDGYSRGAERGRYERYEQGKSQGYDEGYDNARRGRY